MARTIPAALALALVALVPSQPTAAEQGQSVPTSLYQALHWRFVGPFRAGWATVAAGVPGQSDTFYFGGAGGGVWKTTDAGRTWQGLMQHESASAVGALAVSPSNPSVIYVGTGQVAARYDIMAGDGVYRSDDAGRTWRHIGLEATRHIGAVLIDPDRADRVLVAALGHVFGASAERGVYLTTDGGAHWQPVLHVNDDTGAVDLAWDPDHPDQVYAAMWQMRIHPWLDYFQPQAGPGSGIYKSDDRGLHWRRLEGGGLPAGPLGRIGVAVARGTGGQVVYASIAIEESALTTAPAQVGKAGLYRSADAGAHWQLVNDDPALASSYFGRVTVAPDNPDVVYVMGQSIRRSSDGGRHVTIVKGAPGGDDYHFLWINPVNPTHMITGADQGAAVTVDGGASWSSWYNQPTGQLYHLAVDNRFPYRIYSGQQDNGSVELWSRGPYGVIDERDWHPVGGDERDDMVPKPGNPNLVFGSGLGGHTSRFDEVTRQSAEISPWPVSTYGVRPTTVTYRYTWIAPLTFSPLAPHAMYLGAQVLFRSLDNGDTWQVTSPDLSGKTAGASGCADPDLTAARACGFGVIYSIAPSPLAKDLIWVGTDDGLVKLTRDGGSHWRNVTPPTVPVWGRIDDVEPSPFDANSAYLAVDLHRLDRFSPLLLKTTDGGRSWANITANLPADQYTTVVRADPVKRGLLYAGTNRGVYVSFNDGESWQPRWLNLPTTWMRDLLVHDDDLILATQGRGIWVLDDIAPLREATPALATTEAHLFKPARATRLRGNENRDTPWPPSTPVAANPPTGAVIDYWLRDAVAGPITLTITDTSGKLVRRFSSDEAPAELPATRYFEARWLVPPQVLSAEAGMHRFVWDLRYPRPPAVEYTYSIAATLFDGTPLDPRGPFVLPGRYTVTLAADSRTYTQPLTVRLDPRVHVPMAALQQQLALAQIIGAALEHAVTAHRAIAQVLAGPGSRLPAGTAERLKTIADTGSPNLSSVAGVLAGLATAVSAADAGPTQGDRNLFEDYNRQLDGLLAAWHRIETTIR
jgi:photosystem II stability/assembly factor-like uncharacterized protein